MVTSAVGRHFAVALFNRGLKPYDVTVRWSEIGGRGRQPVRDLWPRKDLAEFADSYTANVPRHGAVMIKVGRTAQFDSILREQ